MSDFMNPQVHTVFISSPAMLFQSGSFFFLVMSTNNTIPYNQNVFFYSILQRGKKTQLSESELINLYMEPTQCGSQGKKNSENSYIYTPTKTKLRREAK